MKLIAFCEAPADLRLVSGLVDRVLGERGPAWVIDNLATPEIIRTWHPDGSGHEYFDVHKLNDHADRLRERGVRVRRVRGHFDGVPGEPGAAMARKAFLIVEALNRASPDELIEVVVVLDVDHQHRGRPAGVKAARDEARRWASFQIACGFPDPEREAWILAGFEPCDDAERQCLDDIHRELGFSQVHEARHLRDKGLGALRNIKRVLAVLVGEDRNREARCWIEPDLAALRERGRDTGLAAFLDELDTTLLPLLDPATRRRPV